MRTNTRPLVKFRITLLLAVLLLPLSACSAPPLWYKAAPIEAWVVDEETGVPVEGVVVVAHWQIKGGLEGGNPMGQMMVMEAVTDSKGRFYFPEWGPKWRPWYGELKTQAPSLLLFKSGYSYSGLANHVIMKNVRGALENPIRSDWDGKIIKLKRFEGTLEEYAKHLGFFVTDMGFTIDYRHPCDWEFVPLMLKEIYRQRRVFEVAGVKYFSSPDKNLLANELYYLSKGCRSPGAFFGVNSQ